MNSVALKPSVALDFASVDGGTRVLVKFDTARELMSFAGALFIRWYAGKWRQGLARLKAMMDPGQF